MEPFYRRKIFYIPLLILVILLILYLFILIGPLFQWLLLFLKEIGIPFLIALIISYLLHPLVNVLVRIGLKRVYAVVAIFLLFFVGLGVFIYMGTPIFIKQVKEFIEQLPATFKQIEGWFERFRDHQQQMPLGIQRGIESGLVQLESLIEKWTTKTVADIGDSINGFLRISTIVMMVPFIVFYMLKDYEGFHERVMRIFPKKRRRKLDQLFREINIGLGNYVSGQLLVSLIVGLLVTIGYLLIGFPYPLLFGTVSMIFNIVPYIGPFLGAVPAMVIGITVSWKMALLTGLVNMIVQTVEGNFISPFVVGRSTQLHPLSIIIAVLVGGEIAGIAGMILAVPILVMMKVIVVRVVQQYMIR